MSVNLPLCGSLPPVETDLNFNYINIGTPDEPNWQWVWTETDNVSQLPLPYMGVINSIDDFFGGETVWLNLGDARADYRFLTVTLTVQTTALVDNSSGLATPWWQVNFPDNGGTASRKIVWTWYYNAYDSRVQALTAQFASGGGDLVTFYAMSLNSDGTTQKHGTADLGLTAHGWGEFTDPVFSLINNTATPGMLTNYDSVHGNGQSGGPGPAVISATFRGAIEYQGSMTGWGPGCSTTITLSKTTPKGCEYNPPGVPPLPGSPDYVPQMITDADGMLANYDLTDLSRSYIFNDPTQDYNAGNPALSQVSVQFKLHHCYYLYPFFPMDSVTGLMRTNMQWAVAEPDYDFLAGLNAQLNTNLGTTGVVYLDGIQFNCPAMLPALVGGVVTLEPPSYFPIVPGSYEIWVNPNAMDQYEGSPPFTVPIQADRNLVRACCIRRQPLAGVGVLDTGSPYGGGFIFEGSGALSGGTLNGMTDYLEVGKAMVLNPEAYCLLQYNASRGRQNGSGSWSVDDGQNPSLDANQSRCVSGATSGAMTLDRSSLLPASTDPTQPPLGVLTLLRQSQCVSYSWYPWDNTYIGIQAYTVNMPGAWWGPGGHTSDTQYWPLCCTEEVGLQSIEADASSDQSPASADQAGL